MNINRSCFTKKLILGVTLVFSFFSFTFFLISQANATTYTNTFYSSAPALTTLCADTSGCNAPSLCWNSEAAGQTSCGTACTNGNAWTKYAYNSANQCFRDSIDLDTGEETCERAHVRDSNTCSTGDKYNSSNTPVMNAGFCSCAAGGAYKTCCSGTTPVAAVHGDINSCPFSPLCDPYPPDEAGCGSNTVVRCGAAGEPACGQPACDTLAPTATPTPTPTPTSTPGPTPTPTPTPTPSCTCLSGAGSCGTNSRNPITFSMPASAWPPGCPVPACSGGWDYHSEDDTVCQTNFGGGYYCWQCSAPLPTPTP